MLVPCRGCRRHVRSQEGSCPFCGCLAPAPPRPRPRARCSRVGRWFFVAGVTGSIAGYACAAYGVPPLPPGPYGKDASADAGAETAAGDPLDGFAGDLGRP